jgi:hypothetical protein
MICHVMQLKYQWVRVFPVITVAPPVTTSRLLLPAGHVSNTMNTVWYFFTAPASGTATIVTDTSGFIAQYADRSVLRSVRQCDESCGLQ